MRYKLKNNLISDSNIVNINNDGCYTKRANMISIKSFNKGFLNKDLLYGQIQNSEYIIL